MWHYKMFATFPLRNNSRTIGNSRGLLITSRRSIAMHRSTRHGEFRYQLLIRSMTLAQPISFYLKIDYVRQKKKLSRLEFLEVSLVESDSFAFDLFFPWNGKDLRKLYQSGRMCRYFVWISGEWVKTKKKRTGHW